MEPLLVMMKMMKNYTNLSKLNTFKERFEYLKLEGSVGNTTFGVNRYINQTFYSSNKWKSTRDQIIIRDNGCDLGVSGWEIYDKIYIHHITPITLEDILNDLDVLYDPENLICCSYLTHAGIHYGNDSFYEDIFSERKPGDTILWR